MSPALAALALTLAVEVPCYLAGLTALRLAGPVRAVLVAVGVNLLTHPVLWLVLAPRTGVAAVLVAEVCVVLVEALVIRLVIGRDCGLVLLLSLGANAASLGVGLLVGAGAGG